MADRSDVAKRNDAMSRIRGALQMAGAGIVWFAVRCWRWCHVLWVCRVAAFSAIAGGALLALTPQALDLFSDLGLGFWSWLAFFVLLLAWAGLIHAMARRALQYHDWISAVGFDRIDNTSIDPSTPMRSFIDDRRNQLREIYKWPGLAVPAILSLSVIGFTGWAMCRARRNLLDSVEGLPEADLAVQRIDVMLYSIVVMLLLLAAINTIVLVRRSRKLESALLVSGKTVLLVRLYRRIAMRTHEPVTDSWVEGWLLIAGLAVTVVFCMALYDPSWVADWLPRALFVPLLFGGAVLVFGEIAALSHRLRTPLIAVMAVVGALLTFLFDHFNDVRWVAHIPDAERSHVTGDSQQITFADALDRWLRANQCERDVTKCPRPIVVAGAGGASRAAFLTASLVGAMVDAGQEFPHKYGDVRSRIFGMSMVSGSAVAGAMMRAAFADAAERGTPDKPPCRWSSAGAWYGNAAGATDRKFDPAESWRDCFQQLIAGDFLSPVIVGLAYRDNFPIGNPFARRAFWGDRAVLLEQAFERRYNDVVAQKASPCSASDRKGLCRQFGYHPDPNVAKAWLPLLFINGTSVATGRRIIVSDLGAGDRVISSEVLVPLAFDYTEIRRSRRENEPDDASELGTNLLMSTAATMSARFPLISPHGAIRDRTGNVVDRIVDGGYFENGGLATAADIARNLRRFGLSPIVIRVVNEPFDPPPVHRLLGPDRPALPDDRERALFDSYTSIARAIIATRSGHEDGYAAQLKYELETAARFYALGVYPLEPGGGPFCRQRIRGRPSMTLVSMSWWMSQPVQAYLDGQLCVRLNWSRLDCELQLDSVKPERCYREQ